MSVCLERDHSPSSPSSAPTLPESATETYQHDGPPQKRPQLTAESPGVIEAVSLTLHGDDPGCGTLLRPAISGEDLTAALQVQSCSIRALPSNVVGAVMPGVFCFAPLFTSCLLTNVS
jgi:hypothetical protein